ncbi:MAG: ScyD/ScyE family protein [Marmoricola sp.]|nr:ScyD/ScyE family protein [Marmoricola sp.]
MRKTVMGVAALTGVVTALASAGAATASHASTRTQVAKQGAPVVVVAKGFDDPFGLAKVGRHSFVVAESSAGRVTLVGPRGGHRVLVSGAPGVAGVAVRGKFVYSVLGGPNESGSPSGGKYKPSSVLRTNLRTGKTAVIANLLSYELAHNPDHQKQFNSKHQPYDSLSNPFSMTITPMGLLVADGGANDVLKVNPRTGRVSTFFVPPNVQHKGCVQANPGSSGCDPVPTGVTLVRGSVWVSTLGAETPGAARVYRLSRTGHVRAVWKNFTALTGIAVTPNRTVYLSQVTHGAPEGAPPPDFNPATVGQIVRVGRHGGLSAAQVTMPVGLVIRHGHLFSTAWSVADAFLGAKGMGQIVKVNPSAFH